VLFRDGSVFFCRGRSRFADSLPASSEGTAKIYVKIMPEALGNVLIAQLDTGAAWSVLDADVAAELSLFDGSGIPTSLERGVTYHGHLHRIWIDILADEGESYGFEATVWVSPEWRRGTFLGYEGFLSRIRFAVDPSENSFYFGPVEA
jgi:hypothetical protein